MDINPGVPVHFLNELRNDLTIIVEHIKLINKRYVQAIDIRNNVCDNIFKMLNHLGDKYFANKPVKENLGFVMIVYWLKEVIQEFVIKSTNPILNITVTNLELKERLLVIIRKMIIKYNLDMGYSYIETLLDDTTYQLNRIQPAIAWQRVLCKYDPATSLTLSPIKSADNFKSPLIPDDYMKGLNWILVMSEKFYYDNACLLCNKYTRNRMDLAKYLRFTYKPMSLQYMKENWYDIKIVGQGTFGIVARVSDINSREFTAVKYVISRKEVQYDMIQFLRERNYLIRASNSPYVVRILRAFQIPTLAGLFMCMEFCSSDLAKYLSILKEATEDIIDPFKDLYYERESTVLINKYDLLSVRFGYSLKTMIVVYVFELFSMLDYLSNCHIVHCDIKPSNIMITENGHLKIADLGLVNNYFHITKPSQIRFKTVDGENEFATKHVFNGMKGTRAYADVERCYDHLQNVKPSLLRILERFDLVYSVKDNPKDYNYLYDTWAMGVISLEIMFLGHSVFKISHADDSEEILPRKCYTSAEFRILYLTLSDTCHSMFSRGLSILFGNYLGKLPIFIGSIINGRLNRCPTFLMLKEVLAYNRKESFEAIDITKVEEIDIFRYYNLYSTNAFLYEMPLEIIITIAQTHVESEKRVMDFTRYYSILTEKLNESITTCFPLQPGLDIVIN